MEKLENKYFTAEADKENGILKQEWLTTTADMDQETYKKYMLKYVEFYENHPMSKSMVDTRNFGFVIDVETQKWVNENIAPRLVALGMKKAAFIVSSDFISQISIEQAVDEQNENPYDMKFFDNTNDAEKWLLED